MIFLLNVLFRFLHVLMVLLPSQRVVTPWLRQMASDVRLMMHVATDTRLAGEVLKQTSRNGGEDFRGRNCLLKKHCFMPRTVWDGGFFRGCHPAGRRG